MANSNFVVQNGLTVGPLTIDATTGSITTSGTIGSTGGFTGISSNQIYQSSSNVTVTGSYVNVAIASSNVASFSSFGLVVSGTTNTSTLIASTVNAATIGNTGATLTGTLSTASQPNITTLAGVTSFGTNGVTTTASGNFTVSGNLVVSGTQTTVNTETINTTEYVSTINATNVYGVTIGNTGATLTGTLSTAAQTNVTSVGTLTGLTVAGTTTTQTVQPSANVTYNLGSTSAWYNTIYGTSTHALYADLAENYQGDKFYNPGTVVMFGGTQEVTVATADTTAVAGVVSTNPATLMNGALTGPNVVPVAFTGRVPCQVIGPVAKGDLMVSAGFGYAKTNNTPQIGQVIGKALQDYPMNAKGVIEVVVGRF